MGFNVRDRVRWIDETNLLGSGFGSGTVIEVHANGRLLVIEPDGMGFLDGEESYAYKGYEDVQLVPKSYEDLQAENARLSDEVAILKTDYDNLRRWYDEAVKKNNELSEQVHDLSQRKSITEGAVVVQVYDGDGDPWQYNTGTEKFEMVGGSTCGRKTLNEIADEFKISGVVTLRGGINP